MKIMDVWIDRDTDRQMRVDLLYNYGCLKVPQQPLCVLENLGYQ